MIYQIHHQSVKTGESIFCSQHELSENEPYNYKERRDFIRATIDEAWEKFPPPEGYQFMVYTEESKYFLKTKLDDNKEFETDA